MDLARTIAVIRKHEAAKRFVYDDATGKPFKLPTGGKATIGIGRNVDAAGGRGLSEDEMDYLLANDIKEAEAFLRRHYSPWYQQLSDVRQAVLVELYHNMGPKLRGYERGTIPLIAQGRYEDAAAMLLTNRRWVAKVKSRAFTLAAMLEAGEWPEGI